MRYLLIVIVILQMFFIPWCILGLYVLRKSDSVSEPLYSIFNTNKRRQCTSSKQQQITLIGCVIGLIISMIFILLTLSRCFSVNL